MLLASPTDSNISSPQQAAATRGELRALESQLSILSNQLSLLQHDNLQLADVAAPRAARLASEEGTRERREKRLAAANKVCGGIRDFDYSSFRTATGVVAIESLHRWSLQSHPLVFIHAQALAEARRDAHHEGNAATRAQLDLRTKELQAQARLSEVELLVRDRDRIKVHCIWFVEMLTRTSKPTCHTEVPPSFFMTDLGLGLSFYRRNWVCFHHLSRHPMQLQQAQLSRCARVRLSCFP